MVDKLDREIIEAFSKYVDARSRYTPSSTLSPEAAAMKARNDGLMMSVVDLLGRQEKKIESLKKKYDNLKAKRHGYSV